MSSLELEGDLAYWRRRLAGSPPLLALATDRPRPATPSTRAAVRCAELHVRVRALALQEGTSHYATLLAALTALLRHYTGQDDLPESCLDEIGIHDNFFDLGGHSLLATQLCALLSSRLALQVSLPLFFDSPSPALLSSALEVLLMETANV